MKLFSTAFRRAVLPVVLLFSFAFQAYSQTLDTIPPVVECANGISATLNPEVVLWASDFLVSAQDDQTPTPSLQLAIRRVGTGTGFPLQPDGSPQQSLTFTCDDQGTQPLELWVLDAAGNTGFCSTQLLVSPGPEACLPDSVLTDICVTILTEAGNGVEFVSCSPTNSTNWPPFPGDLVTDQNGFDCLGSIVNNSNVSITPTREDNPLNGVNVWDMYLMSRHILGLEPLNSVPKIVSADINKSGSVTTFDIVELRKLILRTYTSFPNNASWRFINAEQLFANPGNPFAEVLQELIELINVQGDSLQTAFIGAKVGDVNLTAVANSTMSPQVPVDSTFVLFTDQLVNAGEAFSVTFSLDEPLVGFQYTLQLTGLEVVDVLGNVEEFGVFSDAVTVAHIGDLSANEFTVKFKATTSGALHNMIQVNSAITEAMGFRANGDLIALYRTVLNPLATHPPEHSEQFQLKMTPNPWSDHTVVQFQLLESAKVRLTFTDETGKLLHSIEGEYAAGQNEVRVQRKDITHKGLVLVRVETDQLSTVQKMMVTDK